jgi:hypothetical protein
VKSVVSLLSGFKLYVSKQGAGIIKLLNRIIAFPKFNLILLMNAIFVTVILKQA